MMAVMVCAERHNTSNLSESLVNVKNFNGEGLGEASGKRLLY